MAQLAAQRAPDESADSRRQALLEVAESIAHHRGLAELFHDLAARLHRVAHFDYLNLVLHDPERRVMRLHILETQQPTRIRPGLETPTDETPAGRVFETQEPLVVDDVITETSFPSVMEMLRSEKIRSFCLVPLTTAQHRLGTLGFGRIEPYHYDSSEVEFLLQVARQVALAVDNTLNFERAEDYQEQLARDRDRLRLLLDVNNAVVSTLDQRQLFQGIASSLRRVMHHDFTSLALFEPATQKLRLLALDFPPGGPLQDEVVAALDECPCGLALTSRSVQRFTRAELEKFDSNTVRRLCAEGVRSVCCAPLVTRTSVLGTLNVASRRDSAWQQADMDLLGQVAAQVAIAVENALAVEEIARLQNRLAQEKLYLEDEIRTECNFEEIVGESPKLRALLRQVETVAPTDSTVLIGGETGTGKELIARAIHNLSARRDRTLIKINCSAIPTGLLESELFGHERGAFTGAIAQKLGRFELADQGTIFLDEVGDIPLELQPKLLRVLQEQEFERLGSPITRRVNVRMVAATNRDLARLVETGGFREDLYYRLNVFPVAVPPLRERREDIPVLVRYFAQKYAQQMNRKIETVPVETLATLQRYRWPGNVRELENLMERAVILSPGRILRVPLTELKPARDTRPTALTTLAEAERDHILRALEDRKWRLGGPQGAAAKLGMKRTTLQSRMQKLGITRPTGDLR
jgi:formate hydrogenlyase transcriptional activator